MGNTAMRFFSSVNRMQIGCLIEDPDQRFAFIKLLQFFKVFLSIIQRKTDRKADVSKVSTYGTQLMLHLKISFPWAVIGPSVHQICAHAWELFQENDGDSICQWSEAPVEAWHKYLRAFKSGVSCRARQCSVEENLLDVFTRMLDMTHPKVCSYIAELVCSRCEENGHTYRSCSVVEGPQNEEDAEIESFYL